jgi:hypothetical protein
MRWVGGVYMMVMLQHHQLVWIASTRHCLVPPWQGVCSPGTRAGLCCVKWRRGRCCRQSVWAPRVGRGGGGGGGGGDQWTGVWFADKERASQQTAGRLLYVRVDMTCTDGVQRVCFENAACSCVWSAASSSRSTGCEAVV